jgi:hypothetical protein
MVAALSPVIASERMDHEAFGRAFIERHRQATIPITVARTGAQHATACHLAAKGARNALQMTSLRTPVPRQSGRLWCNRNTVTMG